MYSWMKNVNWRKTGLKLGVGDDGGRWVVGGTHMDYSSYIIIYGRWKGTTIESGVGRGVGGIYGSTRMMGVHGNLLWGMCGNLQSSPTNSGK